MARFPINIPPGVFRDGTVYQSKGRYYDTYLVRWYGEALATGLTIEDVAKWPDRVEAVTGTDVANAARKWLDRRRSVTGFLMPSNNDVD